MEGGTYSGRHIQWEAHTVGRWHILGRRQVGEWRGWVGGHAAGLGLHLAAGAGQCGTRQGGRRAGSVSGGSPHMGSHGSVLFGVSQWHATGWGM